MTNTICTFYELVNGDDTEGQGEVTPLFELGLTNWT